jgi:hypothetical protein
MLLWAEVELCRRTAGVEKRREQNKGVQGDERRGCGSVEEEADGYEESADN